MKKKHRGVGFLWGVAAVAALLIVLAIAVGSTLKPHETADSRVYFTIAAGLVAAMLALVAQAWRFLMIGRR